MKEWYILSARPAGLAGLLWCQLTDTTQLLTVRHVVSLGQTHYSDSKTTSFCSYSSILRANRRSNNYKCDRMDWS